MKKSTLAYLTFVIYMVGYIICVMTMGLNEITTMAFLTAQMFFIGGGILETLERMK